MKNSDYWKRRFSQLEQAQHKKGEDAAAEIQNLYRRAQKELEGKINAWYRRFAENNHISMAEAKKMLSSSELKELKWDLKEYIKYGKDHAVSGRFEKELENASAKFHVSKYEALKIQTQQSLEALFAEQFGIVSDAMERIYKEGFYHTAYEIQNGLGIGFDIAGIDQRQVEKVILKPWAADGKNFSKRIWGNKEKLIAEAHSELTQNILLGEDPQKAIDNIAKKMNASKNNAGRLVMTEEAYFSSAAQRDCFRELGVEEYEVVATLDSRTSEICRKLDGKHFPMEDYQAGVTAPPFHVYCRSTTVPYFEDVYGTIGKRAARDGEKGKTYYIPADMDYQEWKANFSGQGDKSGFVQIPQIFDEAIRKANEEFGQLLANSESTPFSDKMILYHGATEYRLNERLNVPFVYNMKLDEIQYNSSAANFDLYDMNFVQAHELSHRMDIIEYHSWENKKFVQSVENARKKVYDNYDKIAEWFKEDGKYYGDMALSDIISALSEGEMNGILYGAHTAEYWQADVRNVYLEIFANISAIDVMGCQSKEEFRGIFEELYGSYKEMVG